MTSWMEERDRLLAQTQAFVLQVAAAHPTRADVGKILIDPAIIDATATAAPAEPVDTPAPIAIAEPPVELIRALRPVASERSVITQRVEAFRARQARMLEEREAYSATMQAKIRSELKFGELGNEAETSRL